MKKVQVVLVKNTMVKESYVGEYVDKKSVGQFLIDNYLDDLVPGESITLKCEEMTQDELDKLPEY